MPTRAAGVCGVEARLERVVEVRTGVRWIKGSINLCADLTDSRLNGSVFGWFAMLVTELFLVCVCVVVCTVSRRLKQSNVSVF